MVRAVVRMAEGDPAAGRNRADWKASIVDRIFPDGKDAPAFGTIGFASNVVLVVSMGEIVNCSGIEASAWEDDQRILVRLRGTGSRPRAPTAAARRSALGISCSRSATRSSPSWSAQLSEPPRRPPIWKEQGRFEGLGDVKAASRPSK